MGFDVNRFQGPVDEELICTICSDVLEDPVQAPKCEHAFCRPCIIEWINRQSTCPIDRTSITVRELTPAPRILRNLLSRLPIKCDNFVYGCQEDLKFDALTAHLEKCEYNPKRRVPIPCDQGCGLIIPKCEMKNHNCVNGLRNLFQSRIDKLSMIVISQNQELSEMKKELRELRLQLDQQKYPERCITSRYVQVCGAN